MYLKYLLLFIYCVSVRAAFDRREGEPCTYNGVRGRCVELKRCYYMIEIQRQEKRPQICSIEGDKAYVCCTDCDLVDDINNIVIDAQRGPLYKDGRRKSWDYCLNSFKILPYDCKNHFSFEIKQDWDEKRQCHKNRMTAVGASGGEDAKRGEFPHMALLGYGDLNNGIQWLCGGSLIHHRYILTAGHCISSNNLGPVTYAALGILKRTDPDNIWQKYRISRIIKHPLYNAPAKYHDIALLKTQKRIQYNTQVLPACLPNLKTPDYEYGWAAGWGALGPRRELANVLQKVNIQKFTERECSTLYQPHRLLQRGFNSTIQICYGDKGGPKDTCTGDSGGPLQVQGGCMYDVIGVTSYGRICGQNGQAGMYTRVQYYVPWIESVVWS